MTTTEELLLEIQALKSQLSKQNEELNKKDQLWYNKDIQKRETKGDFKVTTTEELLLEIQALKSQLSKQNEELNKKDQELQKQKEKIDALEKENKVTTTEELLLEIQALKSQLSKQNEELNKKDQELQKQKEKIDALEKENKWYFDQWKLSQRRKFGPSSEKGDLNQLTFDDLFSGMFNEVEAFKEPIAIEVCLMKLKLLKSL